MRVLRSMEGEYAVRSRGNERGARLVQAGEHLGDVLEAVDLERDSELAEALVTAVSATDRAVRIESSFER